MRILMVSDVYFPRVNGVSTSIRTFRDDLEALGHSCTLVAPAYPATALAAVDDPRLLRVPSRAVPRDPEDRMMSRAALRRVTAAIQPGDVDVIHIQTPFIAHYAGLELARRLRVPVVESYHTYFEHYLYHYVPALPAAWLKALARRFTVSQCHAVDAVISPSRAMADALRAYGVRTRIEVLPTGLDAGRFRRGDRARFRAQHGIAPDRPVMLFVGRVAHEKNIDFLLDLLPQLRQRVPNVLFVLAGEGPAAGHCRERVQKLGLTDQVRFVGNMNRDTELLDCYAAADVFAFASRTETQGLVLIEALAQGTPVVSTAVMGTAEVLAGARGALVVPEQREAFVAALARVLTEPSVRAELAGHAREDAARWASREMAQRLVGLYETVIESRAVTRSSLPRHAAVVAGADTDVA
jgi:glycosyltransferase involved in cell wall biosynthesis